MSVASLDNRRLPKCVTVVKNKIVFVRADGSKQEVLAENGDSIMSAAVDNDIVEIAAECGGACACGTCHCYIDADWQEFVEEPDDQEQEMLECVIEPNERSRLSCQIQMSNDLDGIVVHLPPSQV